MIFQIPGLRQIVGTFYKLRTIQTAMSLPGARGPLTAGMTIFIYFIQAATFLERRIDEAESRFRRLERDYKPRMISLEEAVRGYGQLPDKYLYRTPITW